MRLHRFFVGDSVKLTHDFWINDRSLIHQWKKVFRLSAGAEVVLFDGISHDRLYQITKFEEGGVHLKHVTDFERNVPKNNVYLFWSLLKKDKNDWVLQKCTELGVSHFVPVFAERSERASFDVERAHKIITEAAEQCGRSDIPTIREPMLLETALTDYKDSVALFVCHMGENPHEQSSKGHQGVLIGPEGGWSSKEMELFKEHKLSHITLSDFTLRAETASVVAAVKVING